MIPVILSLLALANGQDCPDGSVYYGNTCVEGALGLTGITVWEPDNYAHELVPLFNPEIFEYTVFIDEGVTKMKFNVDNDNDRFWVYIFTEDMDWTIQVADITSPNQYYAEQVTYEGDPRAPIPEITIPATGDFLLRFRDERAGSIITDDNSENVKFALVAYDIVVSRETPFDCEQRYTDSFQGCEGLADSFQAGYVLQGVADITECFEACRDDEGCAAVKHITSPDFNPTNFCIFFKTCQHTADQPVSGTTCVFRDLTTTSSTTSTTTTTTTTRGPTETQVTTETPVIALPEQKLDVLPCDVDSIDATWVSLISDDTTSSECALLTAKSNNGEELKIEDTCPCFTNTDTDTLYALDCRPNEATPYTFSDMAHWCNGDEVVLEGPTATTIAFNKTLTDFDISTWSGVDDEFIYPGQKMRQTFVGYDMDPELGGNANYMLIEFDACLYGTWEAGDAITVEIGYEEVYKEVMTEVPINYGTDCADGPSFHFMIVPLDPYFDTDDSGNYHEFTLGFTSNLAGARDDEYFSVEPKRLELFTRQDVSTYCMEKYSYNASVNYPIFVQETSGFIHNYAASPIEQIRLHLEVEVPRRLYDFTIDFDDGNTYAGYNDDRMFVGNVNDPTAETYWTSDLLTDATIVSSTQDNCGYEKWIADIPWPVFNEDGAGGVKHFNTGTFFDAEGNAIDTDTDWYLFGSTSVFTGYESIYTEKDGREWETERYSTWRVPFVVRFQRIIFVETEILVLLCPDPDTGIRDPYCTITHVAALVEQVQANTVYDLETREYRADVNLKIDTQVFYPYMLVSGQAADDPPEFWEDLNRTEWYPPPLADETQWFPPTVEYVPADYVPAETQVMTEFTWLSEDVAGCTYEPHNDIELNLGRYCKQYWNMYIKPLNGACYIDGDYIVTWSARCYYDKPVCTFNKDAEGNTVDLVQTIFTVHSTNMCPELVHEVDIYAHMCPTGRYKYEMCENAQSAAPGEDIITYFQDDFAHFFIEVNSDDAKIIYTEILEIWVDQDFADFDGSDAPEPAGIDPSFTPTDYDFNGLVKLWDSSNENNDHTFTNSITGLTETVLGVIEDTKTSNDFTGPDGQFITDGHGLSTTEYGRYAGYKARLDRRIFPRTTDRWLDATFRVKLLVWYEGWGNSKPDAIDRRLLEEKAAEEGEYSIGGQQSLWLNAHVEVKREVPQFVPCFANKNDQAWTVKMQHKPEQWKKIRTTFDDKMRNIMNDLFETDDIEYVGYTQDQDNMNQVVTVWRGNSAKWEDLVHKFTVGDFSTAPLFYDMTVSDVFCLDASQDVGLIPLTECATGKPCTFLPDQVSLEDYYGQKDDSQVKTPESSVVILSTMMAFIWALLF